jgi:hypothetical protein
VCVCARALARVCVAAWGICPQLGCTLTHPAAAVAAQLPATAASAGIGSGSETTDAAWQRWRLLDGGNQVDNKVTTTKRAVPSKSGRRQKRNSFVQRAVELVRACVLSTVRWYELLHELWRNPADGSRQVAGCCV